MSNDTDTAHPFIVVGVDGSDAATGAALWAAAEAQRRGVALRLVHAYSVPADGIALSDIAPEIDLQVRESAGAILVGAQESVNKAFPGLVVSTVLHQDSPVTVLNGESASAVLTVVGSHGRHQLTEALLGSVAARVAEQAHGPIVVIRAEDAGAERRDHGPVIVGLDGSEMSDDALAFAFEEAALRRVPLVAIRAWDNGALDGFLGVYPLLVDPAAVDEQESGALAEQLTPWQQKYPEVAVRPMVVQGRPTAVLLRACSDPDRSGHVASLVVVGSHGRGGFTGMLMGSVSRAVIAHAPCGVAVVRSAG